MNNLISPNTLIRTLVIGYIALSATVCAQQEPSFNPFQLSGITQPEQHTTYQSAQAWADVYKKNELITINKEAVSLYANVPLTALMANGREILTMAGITTGLAALFLAHFPREFRFKTTMQNGFFFNHDSPDWDSIGVYIVVPAIWLGMVFMRLPALKQELTTMHELWNLATQKTPLLSLRTQGIVINNKTKYKWTEIGSVSKTYHPVVQPDGTNQTTVHLAIFDQQGSCVTEIPGIILPATVDAVLELITYYQQKNDA